MWIPWHCYVVVGKQLAFIEAKAKEYFQLHNEPQKTCCKLLKVIPWSYLLQKIFKPWVHSLAIHTMTKQMWESSKKIKIKYFTFTFQLHQSHKPKQENNLGQTCHKPQTHIGLTTIWTLLWRTTLPYVALCGFGIKAVISLGLRRCTSKTRTLYNSNLWRITAFQKHICFENVAPISITLKGTCVISLSSGACMTTPIAISHHLHD
jgi:hypothetical protein